MLSPMNLDAVRSFLNICKREIPKGNCRFIKRNININGNIISSTQALLNIGIMNQKQIWEHVLNLTENDCVKVSLDYDYKRDTNSEIFIFKKIINKKMVYIKLTMREIGIICISFHESN